MKTSTGLSMTTTPKTSAALEVREQDSLVESPAVPKLGPPTDPMVKPVVVKVRTKASPYVAKVDP
jgi:hypothetical protein